jgi:SRSO17 transposase
MASNFVIDRAAEQRLQNYFDSIGRVLGLDARRASFATYAMGIFGDAERKSVEPIAARACPNPNEVDALHQRLLHFVVDSRWDDHQVRHTATAYAIRALIQHGPIVSWIIDDTGFLKQGSHSVGVQRMYTGSAGKIANCQIGTSLSVASATEHLPIDFELYLPRSWAEDPDRRTEARIPEGVVFQTKPELALKMIQRAVADGVPPGDVLADAAYGTSREFRAGVRKSGLHYGVGVEPQTKVWLLTQSGQRGSEARSVKELAFELLAANAFRRTTWREGTKEKLWAYFAMRRVVPAYDDPTEPPGEREPLTLLIEWRPGEAEPANYFLISKPVRTRKAAVLIVMQRWRTERAYEDLKGELGLDHYEGRRFPGWHHHVSVVLCCYAFLVAERVRHFPPSARWEERAAA